VEPRPLRLNRPVAAGRKDATAEPNNAVEPALNKFRLVI
jgi:hypothetical protein